MLPLCPRHTVASPEQHLVRQILAAWTRINEEKGEVEADSAYLTGGRLIHCAGVLSAPRRPSGMMVRADDDAGYRFTDPLSCRCSRTCGDHSGHRAAEP